MNIGKHFDWFKALEQKEEAKAKKAELAGVKKKEWEAELPAFSKMMQDSLQKKQTTKVEWLEDELMPMTKANLLHSAYKKELEKAMFFGGSSHSSGDLAYFDQPSSWKPLPQGSNYYWSNHTPAYSASATYNYTQIYPSNPYVAFEPMTIERAIELNNGVAA